MERMTDAELDEILKTIRTKTQGIVNDFDNRGLEIYQNGDDLAHRKLLSEKQPFAILNVFAQNVTPFEFKRIVKKRYLKGQNRHHG